MHDYKNRPLNRGDTVLIPAVITELSATEDYCNVTVESLYGRRPDGLKEHVYAINTGVLLRANADDAESFALEQLSALASYERPAHELFVPTVFRDEGGGWCALYGDDLQVGVSGFGDTPAAAVAAFDKAWNGGE
jgi:hypothetical protein